MNRTFKLLSAVILLLGALSAASGQAVAQDASKPVARPNILWITSEDHGPEMGCYGDANARTPNVDALAARGMLFKRAWSVAPVCAPARTAIITGLYPSSGGGLHMRSMVSLPAELTLAPQFLRNAGYYCTNASKEDYNVRQPVKAWDESSGKAHWRNRAQGQPFFAVFNSTKSHESQIRTRPHKAIADPAKMRLPAFHPDLPAVRQDWAQYYDKVSEADADAGRRLKEIQEAGLAEETIVFYYGDHGSGMPRYKRWPSNSGLHVPMVVYFPEKWRHLAPKEYQPGGKSDRMVSFVDLAPTILSLAGVKPPPWMQGHAFAGPHQTEPPKFLFGERGRMDERMDHVRSVTDGRYVYLRNYYPHVSQAQHVDYQFQTATTRVWHDLFLQGKTTAAQSIFWSAPRAWEELYDLQTDRDEVRNLSASPDHQEILKKLRAAQQKQMLDIRDVCLLPEEDLHVRSKGATPYELARDEARFPLARIHAAAEAASNPGTTQEELLKLLGDEDRSVRYWAVTGMINRGAAAIGVHEAPLGEALQDNSASVRIAAAQALGLHGSETSRTAALGVLRGLASPAENGVLVSMTALSAIEALGGRAESLHEYVGKLNPKGPSPHERFNVIIPRLIKNIAEQSQPRPDAAPER